VDIEQLAILGIIVFSFMAIVSLFNAIRTYKRTRRWRPMRVRRLIGGQESARLMAESIVREIADKLEAEVLVSRERGALTERLEEALADARIYFMGRVEPMHKTLFSEAINKIILEHAPADNELDK
jgi:hypothetical protein